MQTQTPISTTKVIFPTLTPKKLHSQQILETEPHLKMIPSDGKFAQLCATEFDLLPLFDHRITEQEWEAYYNMRKSFKIPVLDPTQEGQGYRLKDGTTIDVVMLCGSCK